MNKQLLFYEKVVPISKQRHADLRIESGADYSFAKSTNSVPIMAVEIPQAMREYTVVFTKNDDVVMPAVILGIESDDNLYVGAGGEWDAKYVPAFVRRYPFVFSSNDGGKNFVLCIDEEFSGCKSGKKAKSKGQKEERLFTDNGERTPYLENMLNFVNSYQIEHRRTQSFSKRLDELGLFEPMQAQITLKSGDQRSLTGFLAVNREKLKHVSPQAMEELAKNDSLELIYLHLHSMRNFEGMAERANAKAG